MRRELRSALWPLAVLASACASLPPPVPVAGDADDRLRLVGEWRGGYRIEAADREGAITFSLRAGRDTARGEVRVVPRGWKRPLGLTDDPAAAARRAPRPTKTAIRFVRIQGDRVSGALEPYRDPDCGCTAYATFAGTLTGDVIEGRYTVRLAHGAVHRGTWRVERRRQ